MQRVERLDERHHVAIAQQRVGEMGQRGTRAQRRVPCAYVKLVEEDSDDASAAGLQPYGLDGARLAGVGELEVRRPEIFHRARLRVGDDDVECDGLVGAHERWPGETDTDDERSGPGMFHREMSVMFPALPVCCTRSKSTTAFRYASTACSSLFCAVARSRCASTT